MRLVLLILAALIVAGGSGYYLLQSLALARQPVEAVQVVTEPPASTDVFVAKVALASGTILTLEHLRRTALLETSITPEMILADAGGAELLVGSVARQMLPQGVPIAQTAIVQPGERGFLAAVLPQGKRAVSIPIGEVAGISGLVFPGDRVDIILTYAVSGSDIASERDVRASETVMRNMRVLALDQRLQGLKSTGGSKDPLPIARIATLEVTPREAEVITLATTLGDLALVLNSVRDGGDLAEAEEFGPLALTSSRKLDPSRRGQAGLPRQMTLDSEVTSLLQREVQTPKPVIDHPEPDVSKTITVAVRNARIQVVRGRISRAVEYGADGALVDIEPATASN